MALQELESELLALSPAEKAEAVQLLLQSLGGVWTGIEKTPGVCGGDARVAGTRIPVWLLVQARELGSSEVELLQNYPQLTAAQLSQAWAYAKVNPQEIEQTMRENDEA